MSSAINSSLIRPLSRESAAGLRRWWWLGALVFAVAAVGSLVGAFGPGAERVYTSSATALVVALPPTGESSAFDSTLVWQHEEAIARYLARSGFLNTVAFGQETVSQLASESGTSYHVTADKVAHAISATDEGNTLHLLVRWPGPESQAIAAAALRVLDRTALISGLPTEDRAHLALWDRLDVTQLATTAALDPNVERSRLRDLAVRLGAGILLALAVTAAASSINVQRVPA